MAYVDSEFVGVLLSSNSNFILHSPAFLTKVFVQQHDKLDWGTEFIVAALFFILILLLIWAIWMHWQKEDTTWQWQKSSRAEEGDNCTFLQQLFVEYQLRHYPHVLVSFNEMLASLDIYLNIYLYPAEGQRLQELQSCSPGAVCAAIGTLHGRKMHFTPTCTWAELILQKRAWNLWWKQHYSSTGLIPGLCFPVWDLKTMI